MVSSGLEKFRGVQNLNLDSSLFHQMFRAPDTLLGF